LEVRKRDLRTELLLAEQDAKNKKRKAEGKPPLPVLDGPVDEESTKRRKLLQQALELDKDDDDEGEATSKAEKDGKGANSEKSAERWGCFSFLFQRRMDSMSLLN
jgi:protein CWC15